MPAPAKKATCRYTRQLDQGGFQPGDEVPGVSNS